MKTALKVGLIILFISIIPTIGMNLGIDEFKTFLTSILDKLCFFMPLKEMFAYFGIYISIKFLILRFNVIKFIFSFLKGN